MGLATPQAPGDTELLRLHLAARDVPCPGCGYNLRGLAGTVCPECAQEVRLSVALSEPRLGPYLATLIGLSMGAAPPTLMLAAVGYVTLSSNNGPSGREAWMFLWWPMIAAVIGWLLIRELAGSKGRVRFLKLRLPWAAAGAAWAFAVVPFAIWFWSLVHW